MRALGPACESYLRHELGPEPDRPGAGRNAIGERRPHRDQWLEARQQVVYPGRRISGTDVGGIAKLACVIPVACDDRPEPLAFALPFAVAADHEFCRRRKLDLEPARSAAPRM